MDGEQLPTDLPEALRWIARHSGENNAWWKNQWAWNKRREAEFKELEDKFDRVVGEVRKEMRNLMFKIYILVGLIVAVATVVGNIASKYLEYLGM